MRFQKHRTGLKMKQSFFQGNYLIGIMSFLEMNYCTKIVPRKDMRLLAHRSEPMQSIQIISELSNS